MKFALIHFRAGATDGVSLEMMKWKDILVELGHDVIFISGNNHALPGFTIKEMDLNTQEFKDLFTNSYTALVNYKDEAQLKAKIDDTAQVIANQILKIIESEKIDVIIPNNVSALGFSLAAGKAISLVQSQSKVKTIYHHHDFLWERERYSKPTAAFIKDYLAQYFPSTNPLAIHCVINRLAQAELKRRRNIDSIVVPNVIDFNQPNWKNDEASKKLKLKLGIKEDDLVFLQATRVEDRKAIELAIDVVDEVCRLKATLINQKLYNGKIFNADSRIYLIIAGLNELRSDKFVELSKKCDASLAKVLFINDLIVAEKFDYANDRYLLWDAYQIADFVTYPSILEGWGNQLIEAIFTRKPILIYEYPVYVSDLKSFNLDLVSLGSSYNINQNGLVSVDPETVKLAAKDIIGILTNNNEYQRITDHNYKIAKREFSYEKLENILIDIIYDKKV